MAVIIQGKAVSGVAIGDDVFVNKVDTWMPLTLGPSVTGSALYKPNGDGTISVCGKINVSAATKSVLFYAPKGYKFTQAPWSGTIGGQSGESMISGTVAIDTTGNLIFSADYDFWFLALADSNPFNADSWRGLLTLKVQKV